MVVSYDAQNSPAEPKNRRTVPAGNFDFLVSEAAFGSNDDEHSPCRGQYRLKPFVQCDRLPHLPSEQHRRVPGEAHHQRIELKRRQNLGNVAPSALLGRGAR
jgi:hypothetical protein